MKNRLFSRTSILGFALLFSLNACEDIDDMLAAGDTVAISEEGTIDSYYQDMDNLGAVAISTPSDDEYSGNGRPSGEITIDDERFCEGTVVTIQPDAESNLDHPFGIITVDFGMSGCTDLRGNVRKGKLIFHYDNWRFQSGSTVTLTTDEYFINGVKLEGTRTSTNITESETDPPKFHVVLEDGKATFPDNATALRESEITWSWMHGASPELDYLIVHENSTANGTTRAGRSYEVSLTEQLRYNRYCGLAVSGIKKYIIDGEKEIIIDYGDGDCDKAITVTINGRNYPVTVN